MRCPDFQPAWKSLTECYQAQGLNDEATKFESLYNSACHPKELTPAIFDKASLVGLTTSATKITPGASFDISWYWKYNGEELARELAAFVHFRHNSKTCFQGDYVLLPELIERAPYDKIYQQQTTINVPESIEDGEYTIWIGLYHRTGHGSRIKPITELAVQRRAVKIPSVIQISDRESTIDGAME